MNERELVLDALLAITRDGEYGHIVLKNMLDLYQYLDKQKRAFITRVVNGTLERQIEIDYIISRFSSVKIQKMKPVIRTILRFGVYQLKYMDSVPDSAVCNEAVKLAEKRGFRGLKGFVNGVLRNVSRNLDHISYPGKEDPVSYLSVKESLPEWLVKLWLESYDVETIEKMGEAFLMPEALTVRFDPGKITRDALILRLAKEGVEARKIPGVPCGLYLSGIDYLGALPSFQEGLFQVQDISSMQVALLADPKKGDQVLDVCAAPGGKALHMAELLQGTGHVEARDLSGQKVELIRENIARSGLTNIEAVCHDATLPDPDWKEKADILIADLPCSGLGVLGRKPDLKLRMTPGSAEELAGLQRRILGVVKDYVKPGGKLLYSTCTIHKKENEENTRWFVEQFSEYTLIQEEQRLPGRDAGDGFYIAMFRKE